MNKHTKIVATIGPSCEKKEILEKMFLAGVNVARLNFSHGSYESHTQLINNIREVAEKIKKPIAILQDIQGPKIRIGIMPDAGVEIKEGKTVVINIGLKEYFNGEIPLAYPGLHKFIKIGDRILIDDGHAEVKVIKKIGAKVYCRVVEGWTIHSNKGLNFPDSHIDISILSDKDKKDIEFGVKMNVDIIALSFVHSANDIIQTRKYIALCEKKLKIKKDVSIFIVAKIERHEALKNIDEIIEETDGVMVARGDLAMEVNISEMPLIQKRIVDKANYWTKPVIVATQMLDSMQNYLRPTRAEITDVANAVIDRADALMLSNETATGKHPVEVIKTMAGIIQFTEQSEYSKTNMTDWSHNKKYSVSKAIAGVAPILAEKVDAKMILVASASGQTGRLVSRFRTPIMVLVGIESERGQRQLCLSWGIESFLLRECKNVEELTKGFEKYVKDKGYVKKGDRAVLIAGEPVGMSGRVNLLDVKEF